MIEVIKSMAPQGIAEDILEEIDRRRLIAQELAAKQAAAEAAEKAAREEQKGAARRHAESEDNSVKAVDDYSTTSTEGDVDYAAEGMKTIVIPLDDNMKTSDHGGAAGIAAALLSLADNNAKLATQQGKGKRSQHKQQKQQKQKQQQQHQLEHQAAAASLMGHRLMYPAAHYGYHYPGVVPQPVYDPAGHFYQPYVLDRNSAGWVHQYVNLGYVPVPVSSNSSGKASEPGPESCLETGKEVDTTNCEESIEAEADAQAASAGVPMMRYYAVVDPWNQRR
jgi:hypothetical protein